MAASRRWLVWLAPLFFLGLVLGVAWHQDHDFWRSSANLYQAAREASGRGDLPRALELARKAWTREPDNSGYGVFLGELHLEAGRPGEALAVFRRVGERDRRAAGALSGQARALEFLGDRAAGLALLQAYLKENPRDREILLFTGRFAAAREEDRGVAIACYRRLYREDPDPLVRRELLDLLVAAGRFKEAIPLEEEEAAQFPENPEPLHRLALLHYWQRDYQAAAGIYQQLLERAAQDAALRLEAARAADAAGQVDQALSHYLWLYGRYRGQKEYALALARLWSQKGNHAEAAAVLAPLAQEARPEPETLRSYALELLLIREFGKSLKAYETAWRAGDTDQETIINLARLYARKQHFAKAAAFWDEAARRQLIKGGLAWEAALTYSYAHRYADALEALGPLHRRDPKNPKVLLFLGQLNFYQKNWGRAAHYYRAYLQENPKDDEVRAQLAEVLSFRPETGEEALGQYAAALKQKDSLVLRLKRVGLLLKNRRWEDAARELKDCPPAEEPGLIRDQARLCMWLGDLEAALGHYQRYLRKNPRDREVLLEKARVLIYLGRAQEALEVLRGLRVGQVGVRLDQPGDKTLLCVLIEAALANGDRVQAERWAMRLFCSQFPQEHRLARDWGEARRWLHQEPHQVKLDLEERAWVARALCLQPDLEKNGEMVRTACDLAVLNLQRDRYHHPSLLILTYLLPRLPRYEDLNGLMRRVPGIRADSPEYVAALAFFDENLGRFGGKMDYLAHVLREYRRYRWPQSPGELLGLAELARQLGDHQAASQYYGRALKIKPGDRQIAALKLQGQMARKEWGPVLASLERQGSDPAAALDAARIYLRRGQYEGVKAAVKKIPAADPRYPQALLLAVQACRLERNYPAALTALDAAAGQVPRPDLLMEKARILEGMGDRAAADLYDEIIKEQPDSQAARAARARRARSRGDWAGAYRAFALALKHAPQDIELLNELEQVRQQMRPTVASRGFPYARGERRPEEKARPWQFSRYDREYLGRSQASLMQLPTEAKILVLPESLGFTDSNKLYGGIFRLSAGFWLTKVLPAQLSLEYREYNQNTVNPGRGRLSPTVTEVTDRLAARLRRSEVALGLGPLSLGERLRLSGEIIGRRYWQRVDHGQYLPGTKPIFLLSQRDSTEKESRDRLFGSLSLNALLGSRTEATLSYRRLDIYDQDPHIFPRLYQSVLNLGQTRLTALHQVDLGGSHQFRPGLDWQGSAGGAWFSDHNRRFACYQGLVWQVLRQPGMQLELNPHFFMAAYRERHEAYFSPPEYLALGLGLNFHRQFFRLPTLILQGAAQGVEQHGAWGPALQGLAALEWEPAQNFYVDPYIFYFREWVDNYRLLTVGISFRYAF